MSIPVNFDNLKTGDIVFTSGKGIFSRGIKRVTDSEVTHVGFVIDLYGVKYIVEMLSEGIQLSSFKRYFEDDKSWIVDIRRPSELTDIHREALRMDLLFDIEDWVKYDWKAIAKFIFKKRGKNSKDKLYCSEKVYVRLNKLLKKYPIKKQVQVSPADIYRGEIFKLSPVTWMV